MTKAEYADYCERFARGVQGLTHVSTGFSCKCQECCDAHGVELDTEDENICDEGGFSWRPCECCQSHLGGDRFAMHAWLGDELVHLNVCVDCMYFNEYGQLDDTTMMEIEE